MKDRIQKLINQEQLTSARFADLIGVQRSSISHILSGRNKPSLEFVQKVLSSFQNINTDWLIFGRGKMYSTNEPVSLFSNSLIEASDIQESKIPDIQDYSIPTEPTEETPFIEEQVKDKDIPFINTVDPNKIDKKIERIVIFYSDKTFEEYRPS